MRILGLDYGDRTVGVAVSDPTFLIAQPLEVIFRSDEKSIKKTIKRIEQIIKEYEIIEIVLGYPLNMDGTEGIRCEKTILFKERLERNFKKMKITLVDERLSTIGANRSLLEAGLNNFEKNEVIDKQAAAFILQGFLDRQKKGE